MSVNDKRKNILKTYSIWEIKLIKLLENTISLKLTFTYKKDKFVRIKKKFLTNIQIFLKYIWTSNIWIADGTFLSASI